MLESAADAALAMPKLQIMAIWNVEVVGEVASFIYRNEDTKTSITWRGTWNLLLEPDILRA